MQRVIRCLCVNATEAFSIYRVGQLVESCCSIVSSRCFRDLCSSAQSRSRGNQTAWQQVATLTVGWLALRLAANTDINLLLRELTAHENSWAQCVCVCLYFVVQIGSDKERLCVRMLFVFCVLHLLSSVLWGFQLFSCFWLSSTAISDFSHSLVVTADWWLKQTKALFKLCWAMMSLAAEADSAQSPNFVSRHTFAAAVVTAFRLHRSESPLKKLPFVFNSRASRRRRLQQRAKC